jgi:virginiamycin B lyase
MRTSFSKSIPIAVAAALTLLATSVAQAAQNPIEKQYKTPIENASPSHITTGADGNLWFTESSSVFDEETFEFHSSIGRITPTGDITEFRACESCVPNDIVQGPGNILYYTNNDNLLGRMTTDGQSLTPRSPGLFVGGNRLAAGGGNIWVTDFNRDVIWKYDVSAETFQSFAPPTPNSNPGDIAVAADGIVWFTQNSPAPGAIASFDPATGVFTETPVDPGGQPRSIAVANDGSIWYTKIVVDRVGRLNPGTRQVTEFQVGAETEPAEIAAAPDGTLWFTQSFSGNAAQINTDGMVVRQSRPIKGSEPAGIVVAPGGDPWYVDSAGSKIVEVKLK